MKFGGFKLFGGGDHAAATLSALGSTFASVDYTVDGRILDANNLFCSMLGYALSDLKGKHHSIFVEPGYAQSPEYRAFWGRLASGQFDSGQYLRLARDGRQLWMRASYTPVCDRAGKVIKVVQLALDITAAKMKATTDANLIEAVLRSQASIEFNLQSEILDVNDNFLKAVGYTRGEVIGSRHSMFVDPEVAVSAEYRQFWDRLRSGEFIAGDFSRRSKSGRTIWLQATYNPVFDANGKVAKVVKLGTDVTERVDNVAMMGAALAALAGGDLENRVTAKLMPSLDKLRSDFNAAADALQSTLRTVSTTGYAVQSATGEIASATQDLSRRTEQQAASLEQTAAALDEITTTVKKTAAGAVRAREVVTDARTDAEKSGGIVHQAVAAMGEIEKSSREISSIISVIDKIAFQTNLLALNAGIEAARAGDAGRGFAVVATEVRALAQRSGAAAKEIKELISESGRQVTTGVALVGDAGQALERIVEQVAKIDKVIAEIASSAQEQSAALSEVNIAVNQMDQVTQQNAAMVGQTAAVSEQLASEGETLNRLISGFKVGAAEEPVPTFKPKPQLKVLSNTRSTARSSAAKQEHAWAEF